MVREYQDLNVLDITEYLKHGIKTKHALCPKCFRGSNVYHIMPFDFRKICTKCEITWMEDML